MTVHLCTNQYRPSGVDSYCQPCDRCRAHLHEAGQLAHLFLHGRRIVLCPDCQEATGLKEKRG